MISRQSLILAKKLIKEQNGQIAPLGFSEEEFNPQYQDDLSIQANPLESTSQVIRIDYDPEDDSHQSEFRYFEDGKQRTVQIGHIPVPIGDNNILLPIHYFCVSAVILKRSDKKLAVWSNPIVKQGVLVEKSLLPDQGIIQDFESEGLSVLDLEAIESDYNSLKRKALQKAKNERLEIEMELIKKWRESAEAKDDFIVIDGTLMNLRDEKSLEKCVGISKSFGSRYFSVTDHNRIMQMEEFERSWAFRFHNPDDDKDDLRKGVRERISWYLKLRNMTNREPEFGLTRIEISPSYADKISEYADRFSRSVLSERLPTSYPEPRWDKHLYPIKACENYLSSIMPSTTLINSSMKG